MLESAGVALTELAATPPPGAEPELAAWFAEANRLFAEASDRAAAGELRAALSSLAAVPQVHAVLVETCADLLSDHVAPSADVCPGQYL